MARLDRLPATAVIDGFKGTLDFYAYKGIPVVRRWPRTSTSGSNPASAAIHAPFARAAQLKPLISDPVKVALDRYRMGGRFIWPDVHVAAFFGRLRPNQAPIPPSRGA